MIVMSNEFSASCGMKGGIVVAGPPCGIACVLGLGRHANVRYENGCTKLSKTRLYTPFVLRRLGCDNKDVYSQNFSADPAPEIRTIQHGYIQFAQHEVKSVTSF